MVSRHLVSSFPLCSVSENFWEFSSHAPSSISHLSSIHYFSPQQTNKQTTASWQLYDRSQLAKPANMDFNKLTRVNFAFFQTDVDGNIWGTDVYADVSTSSTLIDCNLLCFAPAYILTVVVIQTLILATTSIRRHWSSSRRIMSSRCAKLSMLLDVSWRNIMFVSHRGDGTYFTGPWCWEGDISKYWRLDAKVCVWWQCLPFIGLFHWSLFVSHCYPCPFHIDFPLCLVVHFLPCRPIQQAGKSLRRTAGRIFDSISYARTLVIDVH